MLNTENTENEIMTNLVYVVVDPTGPYVQGVYTSSEAASIGARMSIETEDIEHGDTVSIIASKIYDTVGAHNCLYIHKAQQEGKTLEDLQKEARKAAIERRAVQRRVMQCCIAKLEHKSLAWIHRCRLRG